MISCKLRHIYQIFYIVNCIDCCRTLHNHSCVSFRSSLILYDSIGWIWDELCHLTYHAVEPSKLCSVCWCRIILDCDTFSWSILTTLWPRNLCRNSVDVDFQNTHLTSFRVSQESCILCRTRFGPQRLIGAWYIFFMNQDIIHVA